MVKEIKADLFLAPIDYAATSCNCFNAMGGGIARVIAKRYPQVEAADSATVRGDRSKLGTFTYADVKDKNNPQLKGIFNLYGQYSTSNSMRMTSYDALVDGFHALHKHLATLDSNDGKIVLGVPYKLGSGLGGGNFEIVRAIINEEFKLSTVVDVLICNNEG